MKSLLSALILPETKPSVHDIATILLFFNSLSYYLPTETDTEGPIDDFFLKDLCTGFTPAPLHDDLNRFNRLLHEMENSRSDDLARLFSSEQSPIATGQIRDRDEASAGSVVSALQNNDDKKNHARHRERLWQARLVLKLAELLDRRESEVTQGMARISSDEQKIFASLEGLNGTESAKTAQATELEKLKQPDEKNKYPDDYSSAGSSILIPIRIKAWTELFLADPSPNRPFILVATNPDNGTTILDRYENTWGHLPQKLFSLSIPAFQDPGFSEPAGQHYIACRNKLRLAVEKNLKYFENFLRDTAVSGGSSSNKQEDISIGAEHIASWEESIKIDFPDPATVYRKLVFYCFPGITTENLLQKLFHLEPAASINDQGYSTAILAILHT